jgi:Sortase domain
VRAAPPVRPPLGRVSGGIAALWLAVASCGAAGGGAASHGTARAAPVARATATPPVMVQVTPIIRSLDLSGAPPAPAPVAGGGTAAPARLRIAAIGVDAAIERLGLNGDGTIEVPRDPGEAGWYTDGLAPGEQGPAVILGHLDSATGPAVFWRLSSLKAGSEVVVAREDGSSATFSVQRVSSFPVDAFPTDQVYGATTDPELRLITCGGQYSLVQRRYLQNVVVFAVLER